MLYFDVDDCLSDFTGYVNDILETNYKVGDNMTYAEWEILRESHQRMFLDLKPKRDVIKILYDKLHDVNFKRKIRLLTAIPDDEHSPWQYATSDKFRWCAEHLIGIPMFIGPYAWQKHRHCKPGDLLVDDKQSNCEEWERSGGKAFMYRDNNKDLIIWLNQNV